MKTYLELGAKGALIGATIAVLVMVGSKIMHAHHWHWADDMTYQTVVVNRYICETCGEVRITSIGQQLQHVEYEYLATAEGWKEAKGRTK